MSANGVTSLGELFTKAKDQRKNLDSLPSSSTSAYNENVLAAIESLEECRRIARSISLFSPNETSDDVATADFRYFLIDFHLGELISKVSSADRATCLRRSQDAFARYLQLLDSYRMLSKSALSLYERFSEDKGGFSILGSSDPVVRRDVKIRRYKEEKELRAHLETLAQNYKTLDDDDSGSRELYKAELELSTHATFHCLDQISQELSMILLKPSDPPPGPKVLEADYRERQNLPKDSYSDRLDPSLGGLYSRAKTGPLLNKEGKPLQPFTLLDSRQRLKDGVFKPDHALPTMTIDEYLEEERRRGGIIDGGADKTSGTAYVNEDDVDRADAQTMKAREWDDFVEANPRGSGNTINRG